MITTILSQRSFNNSWVSASSEHTGDVPSGVFVDISVSCPALLNDKQVTGIYISALTLDTDHTISCSLVADLLDADPVIIGELRATKDDTKAPTAFSCTSGIYASVLLGYIPEVSNRTVYKDIPISKDLLLLYTPEASPQPRHVVIEDDDTSYSLTLTKDMHVVLDPGLQGSLDGATLSLQLDDELLPTDALVPEVLETVTAEQMLLRELNGAAATKPADTVYLSIKYGDSQLSARGYPDKRSAQWAVIESYGKVDACDLDDPIDAYIGLNAIGDGESGDIPQPQQVLDKLYDKGVRDVEQLFTRTYGWIQAKDTTNLSTGRDSLCSYDAYFDEQEDEN